MRPKYWYLVHVQNTLKAKLIDLRVRNAAEHFNRSEVNVDRQFPATFPARPSGSCTFPTLTPGPYSSRCLFGPECLWPT